MKNKLFTLLNFTALLFFNSAFAQTAITITKSDMPAAGDTLRFSAALPSQSIDLTQTGANYTWDFSQLQPITQKIDTFFAISALPTSYKIIFAGASFATHTNVPDSLGPIALSNVYTMYQLNSSLYGGLGVGEEIDGIPTPIKYDSADVLYSFPLNYNELDSSHCSYSVSIPSIGYTGEKRKRVNECDGWGTLTTPYGTFNVLRVKSTLTLNDSVYIDALSTGSSFPTTSLQYKWLANGQGEPLLEIDAQNVLGSLVIKNITYRDSVRNLTTTGITPVAPGKTTIFPDPVSDKLFFTGTFITAKAQLKIYSIFGTLVYRQDNFDTNLSIDVSNFYSGAYIAELQQGTKIMHTKFIVTH